MALRHACKDEKNGQIKTARTRNYHGNPMVNFENLIRTSALTVNWLVYQPISFGQLSLFSLYPSIEIIIKVVQVESVEIRNPAVSGHDT